jgi:transposase
VTNTRLFDLVRYSRAELHESGLITDEEYVMLASDSASVERLEDYDKLRAKLDSFTH